MSRDAFKGQGWEVDNRSVKQGKDTFGVPSSISQLFSTAETCWGSDVTISVIIVSYCTALVLGWMLRKIGCCEPSFDSSNERPIPSKVTARSIGKTPQMMEQTTESNNFLRWVYFSLIHYIILQDSSHVPYDPMLRGSVLVLPSELVRHLSASKRRCDRLEKQ